MKTTPNLFIKYEKAGYHFSWKQKLVEIVE